MKTKEDEYCLPFDNNNPEFWMRLEHLGRYLFASDCVRRYKANTVLDVACANGYGCFELANTAEKVFGIDYNKDLIGQAIRYAEGNGIVNTTFYNDDLNTCDIYKLVNEPCDLVTCFDTLEHLQDPPRFLSKINSMMRGDGKLMISVPKADFEPVDKEGNLKNPYHLHRFSLNGIKKMLKEAGFELVNFFGQPYTNISMTLQSNVCRDIGVKKSDVLDCYNQSKESMRILARMYGAPSKDLFEFSYNMIFIAKKRI